MPIRFPRLVRYTFRTLGILALLLLIGVAVFVEFYAPYWVIQPRRNSEDKTPAYYGQSYEPIRLKGADGIPLEGYWVSASQPRGTVLLVHGIRGFKEYWWWSDLPQTLQQQGFNVVAFDNRAHGKSGGEYCTYGYHEQKDIAKIMDYIESRHPDLPVALWGHSLGGCIALMALEKDPRIDVGIIESTFTDMHQIVYDYKKRMCKGIGIRFLSDRVTNNAAAIAGFDPYAIRPIAAAARIQQPVFISHGTADNKIKFEYGQLIFNQLASACKVFYPVPQVKHIEIWEHGGKPYQAAILQFLNENI